MLAAGSEAQLLAALAAMQSRAAARVRKPAVPVRDWCEMNMPEVTGSDWCETNMPPYPRCAAEGVFVSHSHNGMRRYEIL